MIMLLNGLSNAPIKGTAKEFKKWNILTRNISAIILGLLILHGGENILEPAKTYARYDPLDEACKSRERAKQEWDNKVSRINLSANDSKTILYNFEIIYSDFCMMKTNGKYDSMKLFRYYDFIIKHLKNVSTSLRKEEFERYDNMRTEMTHYF